MPPEGRPFRSMPELLLVSFPTIPIIYTFIVYNRCAVLGSLPRSSYGNYGFMIKSEATLIDLENDHALLSLFSSLSVIEPAES
jgi:hypothetical protein